MTNVTKQVRFGGCKLTCVFAAVAVIGVFAFGRTWGGACGAGITGGRVTT